MSTINFGVIGAGYMGKAHAVALHAVKAVFDTGLTPVCEMICTSTEQGAREKARSLGFNRATSDWRLLVRDPLIDAVIIATPQELHCSIACAALSLSKPTFCEKPLASSLAESRKMVAAAKAAGVANMVGFNYIRTPASQLARQIIASGEIGAITYFRGEHTEDFLANPQTPASWRTRGESHGTMGDLAPHMINAALALVGPIETLIADIETVHHKRPHEGGTQAVTNDDHGQMLCRFASGTMGALYFSRIASGRKMGYCYEVFGTKGALRFDQEDQNALWLYHGATASDRQGFTKILTGPDHPDFRPFCLGAGHGTGYQDQIIIEARDFLCAIETKKPVWPTFRDGMEVDRIVAAARVSAGEKRWVSVSQI